MRGRAVVALEVVLDGDLPVALDLPVVAGMEAQAVELDSALGDVAGERAQRVGQRTGLGIRVDEDERAPRLRSHRKHREAFLVEVGLAFGARRLPERAVEVVRPRVIRALERLAVAVALRDQVPPMAADVDEPAQDALPVAHDHDRNLPREAREVVAGALHPVGSPGVLPRAREDTLAFQPLDRRVGVPVGGKRRAGRESGSEVRLHAQSSTPSDPRPSLRRPRRTRRSPRRSGRPRASIPPRGRAS